MKLEDWIGKRVRFKAPRYVDPPVGEVMLIWADGRLYIKTDEWWPHPTGLPSNHCTVAVKDAKLIE